MAKTIVHRGPDDEGFFVDSDLGLAFRRLSIIDLSGGRQPMSDPEEKLWIIFNGEIYNFPELRRELEAKGCRFRTQSDTEVILHGYRCWGEGVLERLNGMFGFALWDVEQEQLLLARDRMGVKCVYYAVDHGRLLFGSEIRPILAALDEKPSLDADAISLFLRFRFTPSPMTVYQGIRKLAPGTRLIVKRRGTCDVRRWWRGDPRLFEKMPSLGEAQEHLKFLYRQAVRRQLISDVPLGLLLSGGMDSALLLALMKEIGPSWPTFTVGYGESFRDDELTDAAKTAAYLDCPNTPVRISRSEFESNLSHILDSLEEPVATSSVVPMYHVCARARQDVKVALIGQGPDELFGGYTRHLGVRYGNLWRDLPTGLRSLIGAGMSHVFPEEAVRRGLYSLGELDPVERYIRVFSLVTGEQLDTLFRADVRRDDSGELLRKCWEDVLPAIKETDDLGGMQALELRSTLPDELLLYGDKMSMAHGLEVRVPYLDQDIVEYVERLDSSFKVRNGRRKWLHRRLCKAYLPPEVQRRKKRGFAVNVVDDWFKQSFDGRMDDCLLADDSHIYQYLSPQRVRSLHAQHKTGSRDFHKILFSLVVLEQVLRNHAGAIESGQPI